MGRLKVFAYCTHSLQPIKTRHNYFVWNISKTVDRLSAACRLTVGQQTADSRPTTDNWPTVDPQLTDSLPTKGQQSPDSWQTDERHLLGTVLHFYQSYDSNNKLRLLARKFYGIFIVIISWRTWKRSVLTSDCGLIDWLIQWLMCPTVTTEHENSLKKWGSPKRVLFRWFLPMSFNAEIKTPKPVTAKRVSSTLKTQTTTRELNNQTSVIILNH